MSSSRDSKADRASADKALEGAQLLAAGDYQGAIAACNEAIKLYPGSVGAHRTLVEAYRRLGENIPTHAAGDAFEERPADLSPFLSSDVGGGIFVGLLIIVIGVVAALVSGSGWLLLLVGGFGAFVLLWSIWDGIRMKQDISSGSVELHGTLSRCGVLAGSRRGPGRTDGLSVASRRASQTPPERQSSSALEYLPMSESPMTIAPREQEHGRDCAEPSSAG